MKKLIMILLMLQTNIVVTYSQMTEQWGSLYNGPRGYDDLVSAMTVDASGNVYVTGAALDTIFNLDVGNTQHIATIKYNSLGVQQWAATYYGRPDSVNGSKAIGVDAAGNVYVTGYSGGFSNNFTPFDWVTIKYDANGVQQWVQRWRGFDGVSGVATAMVVDALGNCYITGYGGIAFNQNFDYVTIKYNTNGVQQWLSSYNYYTILRPPYYFTQSSSDNAFAIAVDNIGNVYVTGSSYDSIVGSGDHLDIATIKYNPAGAQLWVQRRTAPVQHSQYVGNRILTDNLGNVFVGGTYLIKYNSSGGLEWEKNSGIYQQLISIVLDGLGDVYAATFVNGATGVIKKYNTLGDSLWGNNLRSIYLYGNTLRLAFDNCLGYVYLCGAKFNAGSDYDYFTIRYNSSGDSLWSGSYNGAGNSSDLPKEITTDALGNLYETGNSYNTVTHQDFATVKYTPSSFFIHTAKRTNLNKAINDNQSTSDSIFIDCSLMNYTTADIRLNIDNLTHSRDSDLEIYLIHPGTTDNGAAIIDTLVYQAGGTGQNFIGTSLDDSASIPINNGTAPFTGSFRPHRQLSQLNGLSIIGNWILKIYDRAAGNTGVLQAWSIDFGISSNTIGIQNISSEVPNSFSLSQNYPNPFNPATKIKFAVTQEARRSTQDVSLVVYDINGKEVETIYKGILSAGTYEVDWNAAKYSSGVYFYKLFTNDFTETKKMILIK